MLHRGVIQFCLIVAAAGFGVAGPALSAEASAQEAPAQIGLGLDSLLGREVSTRPDGDIGRVVDLLVDGDGKLRAAVVEFGGFLGIGTRKIAVDWSAFRIVNGAIVVNVTRDRLRAAKDYKASDPASVVQSSRD